MEQVSQLDGVGGPLRKEVTEATQGPWTLERKKGRERVPGERRGVRCMCSREKNLSVSVCVHMGRGEELSENMN